MPKSSQKVEPKTVIGNPLVVEDADTEPITTSTAGGDSGAGNWIVISK
jgi:hypothetical protein